MFSAERCQCGQVILVGACCKLVSCKRCGQRYTVERTGNSLGDLRLMPDGEPATLDPARIETLARV